MAKGPFHFKTFSVEQDGAAMKVGMDGIVLGSWSDVEGVKLAIDVGAGNGYVGLMLLQRMAVGSHVLGVELEPQAAAQCEENFKAHPFTGRDARSWTGPVQSLTESRPDLVSAADLVVSNPPFFRNKTKSLDTARNLARHDDTLPMGELAQSAATLLKPGGRLCTIWPIDRLEEWQGWCASAGFCDERTVMIHTMRHLPCKRFLSEWRKAPAQKAAHRTEYLTLEGKATLDFTDQYLALMRQYLKGT